MNNLLTHYPVNWIDGMKLSSSHFTAVQDFVDEWKGYKPIKDFNITQISSNDGKNFPTLHKVIHQVKSWIRGIYSWVSEFNIDRYLAEYSFRINRSQSKETIFNKLMKRIVERSPVSKSQLVCS